MHVNGIADKKTFWMVVKPNFSNKILGTNRVILRDGRKVISDTEKVADTLNNNVFSFPKVSYEEILNEINSLNASKSTQSEDIPFRIIKDNSDIFANFILQNFNKSS